MRSHVTVIPDDSFILVDGEGLVFAFAASDALHALQWREGAGHVEYRDGRPNRPLGPDDYEKDVEPFVDLWTAERNKPAPPLPEPTFEEARAARRAEIISGADAVKRLLAASYSIIEESSWPEQEAGARVITGTREEVKDRTARLLLADPGAAANAARLVERLAAIDGCAPEDFAGRVISNADAAFALGMLTLEEQRGFEAALREAGDIEEIKAITVRYTALAEEKI